MSPVWSIYIAKLKALFANIYSHKGQNAIHRYDDPLGGNRRATRACFAVTECRRGDWVGWAGSGAWKEGDDEGSRIVHEPCRPWRTYTLPGEEGRTDTVSPVYEIDVPGTSKLPIFVYVKNYIWLDMRPVVGYITLYFAEIFPNGQEFIRPDWTQVVPLTIDPNDPFNKQRVDRFWFNIDVTGITKLRLYQVTNCTVVDWGANPSYDPDTGTWTFDTPGRGFPEIQISGPPWLHAVCEVYDTPLTPFLKTDGSDEVPGSGEPWPYGPPPQ